MERILLQRLGRLIDLDALTRRTHQTSPPRHEYVFTENGLALYLTVARHGP
ncbi:winged helix-turn-helix transcriptional regulator [Streptomyces sp. NPDC058335]|uniref:winged helix-turn-helix transcriptional regulator n=1 Tax=Streptomyces sp. NPDC058335 TaxID=3346451 RepID=UPI00366A3E79